jgi:hypothetical protein
MQVRAIVTTILPLAIAGYALPALAAPAQVPAESAAPAVQPAELLPSLLPDPYVLLDEAKTQVGDGKLHRAEELLAAIPTGMAAEKYVDEEILLQRLLLCGAFMRAAGAVLHDASNAKYASSTYSTWLRAEHARYAKEFADLASEYLAETADGLECDFIRFRLPRVTAEHLKDIALYADPQVLRAAVENWDQDKQGLGKGLIATQARVALVLEAAAFYDLSVASATIEGVSGRLRNGVPLTQPVLLDWLAQAAVNEGEAVKATLEPIRTIADGRLKPLLASDPVLTERYNRRNGLVVAAKETPPAAKLKPKGRSNKRRR